MSSVRFYHYEPSSKEPKEYNFPNGMGWNYSFEFLFSELAMDKNLVVLNPQEAEVLRNPIRGNPAYRDLVRTQLAINNQQAVEAFNVLQQREDVERWQKIAMGFGCNYSLVRDNDRDEVANVLRETLSYLKANPQTQAYNTTIIQAPLDSMLSLKPGPLIVTTSNEDPAIYVVQDHSLEELLQQIPRATSIPRLIK